ncbi:ABC transporter substrate-binding protein [Azoarcus sp. KH32C]|uniref:ABC transporter substrate-binding protein n=1 Tax=Azoarcus sp. KH32C TaxID=748247 RepID=UPI00023869AB|nr:ABC transporter substrate-binding protein [Azoarcus sp. KH32C]BAL25927.1 hypothetical protein AZKH_3642 [Azoarcus sp. KH32C]
MADALRHFAGWILTLAIMGLAGCGEPEPIRIGFLGGLSGRASDLGIGGRNGTLLAVEQANAAGGIAGRRVELIVRDDAQKIGLAQRGVAELLATGVEVIIGPMTSAMTEVVLPLTKSAGIPVISPSVTSTAFSGLDDQFFRVTATTREYASASARYLAGALGRHKASVIYDRSNDAFSADWVRHFSAAFASVGGEVVRVETFESAADMSVQDTVARALELRPDALVVVSGAVDLARIAQLVRRSDRALIIMGSTWAATEELVAIGGRAVEGVLVPQMFDREDSSPRYQSFRSAYVERFGEQPGYGAVLAYDAARVALEALQQTGSGRRARNYLIDHTFAGLQQPLRIDAWGDTRRDVYMTRIRNGRFSLEAKLSEPQRE